MRTIIIGRQALQFDVVTASDGMKPSFENMTVCPSNGLFVIRLLLLVISLFSSPSFGAPVVRVATLDFPPYVSESLAGNGWAWQVVEAAFSSQNHGAQLFILPWPRAVHQVRKGSMDALYIANKTQERESWAYFSHRVGQEDAVLWKRRASSFEFFRPEDLQGKTVGGLRGSAQTQFLQQRGVDVVNIKDLSQGIKMLSSKRLDYFVADRIAALYCLESLPPEVSEAIDYVSPPIYSVGFHLAIAKNHPQARQYIDTFNRGLLSIRESGRYQQILRQYKLAPSLL